MKNLKYIQIFEAFESKILSRTLAYIKEPNDKQKFFDQVKKLCGRIDYPLSKIIAENHDASLLKKVLGLNLIHPNEYETQAGAKVIKNVSGYDMMKKALRLNVAM